MTPADPTQFLGLRSPGQEKADALLLPLPVEKTVSYGVGASGGPRAIIEASHQLESYDVETGVEFSEAPRIHTLAPLEPAGDIEDCLKTIQKHVRTLRGKFLAALGGEHTVTYGMVHGLIDDLSQVTVVQIDAHADLADELRGRRWSHGTVMRRLWEEGCRLLQVGVRSMTREEHDVTSSGLRIATHHAHRLGEQWGAVLDAVRRLEGDVYLTIDVDGLDPSIIPSTGTPLPDGLSWRQTIELIRVLTNEARCRLIGADVVEFVPSAAPPGCDPVAAQLTAKLLAWWWLGQQRR